MRSMTGFGEGHAELSDGSLFVEIRSLNHKHQDIRLRLPNELSDHGFFLEQAVRSAFGRGRYEVLVRVKSKSPTAASLDRDKVRHHYQALSALRDELAPGTQLRLGDVLVLGDIYRTEATDQQAVRSALESALKDASQGLLKMRQDEGLHLSEELTKRLSLIETLKADIEASAEDQVDSQRRRLRERVSALLAEPGALAEERLELEIALLADKSDITEELVRLSSHLQQFRKLCSEEEPVGRRLDFLLQEMSREVNTIGSKSQHAKIAHLVVDMKSEVERLREQVQNIE